ncbi:DUF4352 domain-containing protein [Mycobacterium heidelbergense]|uniref:DUF4352 domain-containing protein n=1 Tax=Mycobacterium heidelbergense TaxID=53376 RepID=A0A1X0DHD8_MYCHE|nr:DUF4352 domain-containing protein [Mycobacterium heidelbergense]MCV7051582.1 DUF4352 domain-containing protein [Mycobacterium heidelbergense]ORA71727.1 hypothetical protein BST25_16310 [Mycobacterium heidelbergense]BBZ52970.1 hypothetical protein MHEI_46870 [Mycobacterium heidelbergense]
MYGVAPAADGDGDVTATHPVRPAGPPVVRVGQLAIDGDLIFLVTSVDRSKIAGDPVNSCTQATAQGVFLTAHLRMTNTGTQRRVIFAVDQKLKVNDTVYRVDGAAALRTRATELVVVPGACVSAVWSFDVPADTPLRGALELHESSTSPGVDVTFPPPN